MSAAAADERACAALRELGYDPEHESERPLRVVLAALYEEGAAAEREACAGIADRRAADGWYRTGIAVLELSERRHRGGAEASEYIATAIRARGEVAR